MTTSLTAVQIPDKSIMDLFGRQAYLGNAFYLPHTGKALASTAETTVGVISVPSVASQLSSHNPALSVFISSRSVFSSTTDSIIFRFYKGPTVTVNGSATTPVNARTGTTTASVASCYFAPTVTVNGTLITAQSTFQPEIGDLIVVDPGTNLLITAQAIANTPTAFVQLGWYEI